WDPATGEERRRLADNVRQVDNVDRVACLTVAPGGDVLAAECQDKVRLWDLVTGEELRHLAGQQSAATALAFSPEGKTLALASYDGTVRLWEAATGRELRRFSGHQEFIDAVAFSPDGKVLAGGGWDKK